jgi:hypothetical protein
VAETKEFIIDRLQSEIKVPNYKLAQEFEMLGHGHLCYATFKGRQMTKKNNKPKLNTEYQ